jgi:TonB dependent receptor
MKAGLDYIYQSRLQRNLYLQFTFSDSITSNINASNTGNSLASSLLTLPATFTAQTPDLAEDYFSMTLWSGYVQDSWKAWSNLTVNFGLRYEYIPGINMLDDRLANGLDIPNQKYIIAAASVPACTTTFANPCIPGGIGSVTHNSNIVFPPGQKVGPPISDNIAPRLGLAYQPNPKTALNGGEGIFYDTITARSQWVQNNIEGPTWPWTTGISAQQTNFSQGGFWPGAAQNPLTKITSLEGNFPNPVVAASPWLTTGGTTIGTPPLAWPPLKAARRESSSSAQRSSFDATSA